MRSLVINAREPEECRVAVVEDGKLDGYRVERRAAVTLVGNIYRGVVVNLESAIGAAFVDIGAGRNAFLHVSDLVDIEHPETAAVDQHLALKQEVLVQVTRDSVGAKGPVLTANISLPGRFLVLLPKSIGGGVSRRIEEGDDRDKLKAIVKELEEQSGMGLIVRTAGATCGKGALVKDLAGLARLWDSVRDRAESSAGAQLLHAESDLVVRAMRDLMADDVSEIVVDDPAALERARESLAAWQPELTDRLRLHDDPRPLFHAFDLETQLDQIGGRRVRLESGGTIVLDQTEALLAIDVNSGRTREDELEETARRTNLEAAAEIARQLRLRDLGGVVAVDFIDMRDPAYVKEVDSAFRAALRKDRSHVRPGHLGAFGIFVLTRRRAGLEGSLSTRPCPLCAGAGRAPVPETTGLRVFRELAAKASKRGRTGLRARLSPEVSGALVSLKGSALRALEEESGRTIEIVGDSDLRPDQWRIESVRG
ncbi:MAG: Rne/Rng family ribonuclease [Planctomycetota bacterium]